MSDRLRVLFWDLETAPMMAYIFQLKTEYVSPDKLLHETFMLSWSAKWEGEKKVHSAVLTGDEARAQDDRRIVESIADLVREADVVVAHHGDRFDVPVLNNRVLMQGLPPLGNVKTMDTRAMAAKSFRMASNKLDHLAYQMFGERKLKTDFDLWRDCYFGEERALKKMVKYNRKDVVLLERVYHAMEPYVQGLPRLHTAVEPGERTCPFCGEEALRKKGTYHTNASSFQKYMCTECGRNSRSRKADKTKLDVVPLR